MAGACPAGRTGIVVRVLHLDCGSGVSGDMWLGALLSLGASVEAVQLAVESLGVGDVRIAIGRVHRAGVAATTVRVRAPQGTPRLGTWQQIRNTVAFAALEEDERAPALATLERLVAAHSRSGAVAVDKVALHEVGALDTVAEVVGTVAALRSLTVERITCSPVAIGTGHREAVHGIVPVPVPAVTELLRQFPVVAGPHAGVELTTPTGAALLAELARPVAQPPVMTVHRVGLGAGAADLPTANVLRATLGEAPTV